MREKLIQSLTQRLKSEIPPQSQLQYLKNIDPKKYVDQLITTVYLYTRPKKGFGSKAIFMTETVCAIGHAIRSVLKLKIDSSLAAKTGAFLLYSFDELGMLEVVLGKGANGHNTFIINVLADADIIKLWDTVTRENLDKLPSRKPYAPWTSTKHPTGMRMVKTFNNEVLEFLTPETHPIVFECLNKAQRTGWRINRFIYEVHLWALRNKTDAFADIWEQQNPEAKATKLREARAIGDIAKRFLNSTFYHMYSYDFRGRKYAATAYLSELGSDLARGLLLRADKKAIGKEGFFWLMVSIASNWAGEAGRQDYRKTDKIPAMDRYLWSLDNEEILLSYAESPKLNQGWMKADKPWQFLAACYELAKLRSWQFTEGNGENDFGYESSIEVYIDGSVNGAQHLAAITKDEVTAPHVNLTPSDLPGDLYAYVANHVWKKIDSFVESLPEVHKTSIEIYIDNIIEYKKQISASEPKSDHRSELIGNFKSYKRANEHLHKDSSYVYWHRFKDEKSRRKIVKREYVALLKPGEFKEYPNRTTLSQAERKVQRLSREGVHPSGWKRPALIVSDDIVQSIW